MKANAKTTCQVRGIDRCVSKGVVWYRRTLRPLPPSWVSEDLVQIEKSMWISGSTFKSAEKYKTKDHHGTLYMFVEGEFGRQIAERIEIPDRFTCKVSRSEITGFSLPAVNSKRFPDPIGIRGQGFAVLVYDPQDPDLLRQLAIVTDRLSSCRIFYHSTDRWFAWSTDLMVLTELRRLLTDEQAALDARYIPGYLKYLQFPDARAAPITGIGCIPPASILQADGNQTEVRSYWKPHFVPRFNEPVEARKLVKSILTDAVNEAGGDSGEPVGVLLSGGLDSTLLLALLQAGGREIWTYAVGFAGADDERADAEFAARRFRSRHRTLELHPTDMEPLLWKVTRWTGCPSGNPSILALYLAAATARSHVERLFSGIGSDEIFCGHRKHVLARYWPAARPLLNLVRYGFRQRREYRRFGTGPVRHYDDLYAFFTEDQVQCLLKERLRAPNPYSCKGFANGSREQTVFLTDLFLWLAGGVLPQSTAAAAACGVSLKTPFCSAAMVELAARIPLHLKVRGNTGKWILRRAFSEVLPTRVLKKRRCGFTLPLGKWLRGPLSSLLERYLNPDVLRSRSLLDPESVFRMIQIHRSGRMDLSLPLWALISLEVWQRIFIDGQTHPLESDR